VGANLTYVNSKTLAIQYSYPPAFICGAICNEQFTSGRHVFACMWPRTGKFVRGAHVMVGLGRPQHLDVLNEYQNYLVGATKTTLGLDLVNNQLVYKGKVGGLGDWWLK
jgi:hypothetical protein